MDDKHVSKDITDAGFNETGSIILFVQILLVAIVVGIGTGSWWWGGGSLLGLCIALAIRPIAAILILLLSLGWGLIGYEIGTSFDSDSARYILASVFFLVMFTANSLGFGWDADTGQKGSAGP